MRRSVENELDRSRVELSSLRLQVRDSDDDGKAGFEVEKLLSSLKTTLEQMNVNTNNVKILSRNLNEISSRSLSTEELSLSERVDVAVKKLGDMRTWMREDSKVSYVIVCYFVCYLLCYRM